MTKTIVTMVVTAVAGLVGYLVSDSFRERLTQKQRDKIASEVARGDDAHSDACAAGVRRGADALTGERTEATHEDGWVGSVNAKAAVNKVIEA